MQNNLQHGENGLQRFQDGCYISEVFLVCGEEEGPLTADRHSMVDVQQQLYIALGTGETAQVPLQGQDYHHFCSQLY